MPEEPRRLVACPQCKRKYPWRPEYAGKNLQYKSCGLSFRVASEDGSADAGQALRLEAEAGHPAAQPAPDHGPQPPAGASPHRACPSCKAPLAPQAVLCVHCGYNLRTGARVATSAKAGPPAEAPGESAAPTPAEPVAQPGPGPRVLHEGPIGLADILKVPLRAELMGDALTVILGWALWMALAFICTFGLVIFLGPLVLIVLLVVYLAAIGWVVKQFMSVANQFETGGLTGSVQHSNMECLGVLLWVTVAASAIPAVPVALLAPGTGDWITASLRAHSQPQGRRAAARPAAAREAPPPALTVVGGIALCGGALVALLYWPMGIAMAGAYGTLSPVKVIRKIAQSFRTYGVVYVYLLAVIGAAIALAVLLSVTAVVLLRIADVREGDFGYGLARWLAGLTAEALILFGQMAAFAMLGMVLRKYRPDPAVAEP